MMRGIWLVLLLTVVACERGQQAVATCPPHAERWILWFRQDEGLPDQPMHPGVPWAEFVYEDATSCRKELANHPRVNLRYAGTRLVNTLYTCLPESIRP